MDRNQIIGLVLISAIIIVFMLISQPSKEEIAEQKRLDSIRQVNRERFEDSLRVVEEQRVRDSIANANLVAENDSLIQNADSTMNVDSIKNAQLFDRYGDFADAHGGEEKFITLKNKNMEIKVSTMGGRVYSVNLTNYKTHDQEPLILFEGDKNKFNFDFTVNQGKVISTQEFYFEPQTTQEVVDASNETKTLKMRLKANDDSYIEYAYTLEPESFVVDFDMNFVNTKNIIDRSVTFLQLTWASYIPFLEHGEKFELQNTSLYYQFWEDDVKELKAKKKATQEDITTNLRWIGYKQQFFTSALIAKQNFNDATISQKTLETDPNNLKFMTSKVSVPYPSGQKESVTIPMAFYFGPNKYNSLQKISVVEGDNLKMHKLVPLGWGIFGWVNRLAIIPLFTFLGSFISNYGLLIFLMTVIIKLVLFPLTYRSFLSSAKMRVLKPEIEKINEKIPADKAMERQQATMALYKKAGVNPMGGCIPIALQFPILIAMFRFFPASIELRQQSFLWAKDLSTYDAIVSWTAEIPIISQYYGNHISLFTLLMAAAIVGSTLLNGNQMQDNNPQAKTMKYMMYLMPVMMIFWFNNYSAGLSYYYLLSNLITIIQTLVMRKMIDEEKLFSKLQQNVSKNKNKEGKKSNFQKKLEDMAKQRGYNQPKKKK